MKRSSSFILALVASLAIWLVSNLSRETTGLVSVPVIAHSSIVGRSEAAMESVQVTANVTASGFRLLGLALRGGRPVNVMVEPEHLHHMEGDFFSISAGNLVRYTDAIFGLQTKAQFAFDYIMVRFAPESYKKVPVVAVKQIRFREQYMATGDIKLTPDSVLVYGNPSRISGINQILTRQFSKYDVDRSLHGKVRLEVPAGTRLSAKDASYSLDVSRYVGITEQVRVGVRNVPEGKVLSVYPSTVNVKFRFIFPISGNPTGSASFYVDYNEFAASIGGKCMVRAEGLPEMTISWEADPEFCDCVESESAGRE